MEGGARMLRQEMTDGGHMVRKAQRLLERARRDSWGKIARRGGHIIYWSSVSFPTVRRRLALVIFGAQRQFWVGLFARRGMFEPDQEEGALRSIASARAVGPFAQDGPVSYEGCLGWAPDFLRALAAVIPKSIQRATATCARGVVMSTDYSGIGTPEMSMSMILHAMVSKGHLPPGSVESLFKVWRAGDIESSCRKVLATYGRHQPEHITGDILRRLREDDLNKLRDLLDQFKRRFDVALGAQSTSATPKKRFSLLLDIGREYMDKACELMDTMDVATTAWCFKHHRQCPLHPPRAGVVDGGASTHSMFYLVVAGWTCVPWSSMSRARLMWLDDCSLVFLAWLFSTIKAQPNVILGECVVGFDDAFFAKLMESRGYKVFTLMVDPIKYGIPSSRRRKFMICVRTTGMDLYIPICQELVDISFHRRLVIDARIYFRSPQSSLRRLVRKESGRRQEQHHSAWPKILDEATRAIRDGYVGLAGNSKFYICNLYQRPAFWKTVSHVMPALLRKSKLYAVMESRNKHRRWERPVMIEELFAAQGVPTLLPKTHPLTSLLPKLLRFNHTQASLIGKGRITESEYRSMAGNGQHTSSVGSMLLLVLCCVGCANGSPGP